MVSGWSRGNASDCEDRAPRFDSAFCHESVPLFCCCMFVLFWSKKNIIGHEYMLVYLTSCNICGASRKVS